MFLLYFMQINFISIKDFQKHLKKIFPIASFWSLVHVYNKKKNPNGLRKLFEFTIYSLVCLFS